MSTGSLQKLEIRAYKDPRFNTPFKRGTTSDDAVPYKALINPEKYSIALKSEYTIEDAQGSSGGSLKFHRSLPENLDLEFLFDRTGVLTDSPEKRDGIIGDLEEFKKHVYDYSGEEHKPNYLKISWGSLLFHGVATDITIDYKLFRPDGTPLRAMVKVTFKNFIEEEKRAARENKQSPDLTHVRTVNEGDTLPLLSYEVYGDSKYYLEVARINELTNFRKLTPGNQIMFPPIDKLA